ncbi:MAG: thermonuclease family protein [Deltaproteobacteria bacterium]|nr:thermonuclease family protein [Deltaproteobacteria bacterium]
MPRASLKKALPVFLCICFCLPGLARAEFQAKVIEVKDGDSFLALFKGRTIEVRIHGIDAPEWTQPFGEKAKSFLRKKTFLKRVTIRVVAWDQYNRAVAEVILLSGENLGHEMVKAGMAWWYRRYAPNNRTLARLEARAKNKKQGLWRQSHPEPPWLFRQRQ